MTSLRQSNGICWKTDDAEGCSIMSTDELGPVLERLERIEHALLVLTEQATVRDWYSVEQFAEIVGKAPYTVREHCRLGRLAGVKKRSGHGLQKEWVLPHSELLRFQKEGLLPERR
jgi:Helix-turn-helix domain